MKKIYIFLYCFIICAITVAQTNYLTIHKKSGVLLNIPTDDVDIVTFDMKNGDITPDEDTQSEYVSTGDILTLSISSATIDVTATIPLSESLYAVGIMFSESKSFLEKEAHVISKNISNSTSSTVKYSFTADSLERNTTYYYKSFVYIVSTGKYYYGSIKSFTTYGSITDGDMIDLGLPSGTLWSSVNIGATTPYECGNFYAWGETTTKETYTLSNYKYYFNGQYFDLGSNISKTAYDAATANWGNLWRMPNDDDIKELRQNCVWYYCTLGGQTGYVVTGANGNSIFLPASADSDIVPLSHGTAGVYWTANANAMVLADSYSICKYNREYGLNVRPVYVAPMHSLPYKSSSLSSFSIYNMKDYGSWLQGSAYTEATGSQKWDGAVTKYNKETESYLISPLINTNTTSDKVYISFDQTIKYTNNVSNWKEYHKVYISKDYDNNPENFNTAAWTELDYIPVASTYSGWDLYSSGHIALPDEYKNTHVYIAFYFYSPATASTYWELQNFLIEGGAVGQYDDEYKIEETYTIPYTSTNLNSAWNTYTMGDNNPWSQGNTFTQATGYQRWDGTNKSNEEAEGYLISPIISTIGATEVNISFDQTLRYTNTETGYADHSKIYAVKDWDGTGNPKDQKLVELTGYKPTPSTYSDWTLYSSGDIALPAEFAGQENVRILFWFYAPSSNSTTWELENFKIQSGRGDGSDTPSDTSDGVSISGTTVTLTNSAVTAGSNTETIIVNDYMSTNASAASDISTDNVTISFAAGSNTNAPKYYTATNGVRVYANNTITFTGKSAAIAKIEMTCDSYNGTDYVGNTTATIALSGKTLVYTNASSTMGTQLRVKTITITYAAD